MSFNEFEKVCNTFDDSKGLIVFDEERNIELIQENCSGIGSSLKLRIPICLKSEVRHSAIENSILEIDLTNVKDW